MILEMRMIKAGKKDKGGTVRKRIVGPKLTITLS